MGALHGGENLIGLLAPPDVPLPVTIVDFTGGYIAAEASIGAWRFFVADRVRVLPVDPETTERFLMALVGRVERWLEAPTERPPLSREEMERLAWTLVDVMPAADVLPHRRRNSGGTAWRQQVGPLTHTDAVPFVLFDAFRAALEDGAIPKVVSGHRLVPVGTAKGVEPIELPSGTVVAAGEDLPLALATFRLRLATDDQLGPKAKERLGGWAKFAANSIVSGLPIQVNRRKLSGKTAKLGVWAPDGTHRTIKTDIVEEPGTWFFAPIGVAVPATQRFFSYLARALVERRGGAVLYQANDSLSIVSTPNGGLCPCGGGPRHGIDPDSGEETDGYHALSFPEVEEIRRAMEAFSPYPQELKPWGYGREEQPIYPGRFGLPPWPRHPRSLRRGSRCRSWSN
jgi:hypothetical protein